LLQVEAPPWDYRASSIFVPRGTKHASQLERLSFSDVKSMHDVVDDASKRRAFNVDWRECLSKEERFFNLCKKVMKRADRNHAFFGARVRAEKRDIDSLRQHALSFV
jgi:hypothetical protein